MTTGTRARGGTRAWAAPGARRRAAELAVQSQERQHVPHKQSRCSWRGRSLVVVVELLSRRSPLSAPLALALHHHQAAQSFPPRMDQLPAQISSACAVALSADPAVPQEQRHQAYAYLQSVKEAAGETWQACWKLFLDGRDEGTLAGSGLAPEPRLFACQVVGEASVPSPLPLSPRAPVGGMSASRGALEYGCESGRGRRAAVGRSAGLLTSSSSRRAAGGGAAGQPRPRGSRAHPSSTRASSATPSSVCSSGLLDDATVRPGRVRGGERRAAHLVDLFSAPAHTRTYLGQPC